MIRGHAVLFVLFVAAVVLGLGFVEIMLRLSGLAAPPAVISVNEKQAAQLPGVFVPRGTVTDRRFARFPHDITVNSLGYRGQEISLLSDGSQPRILFVGDSFTWGDLVDDSETLPFQLEQRLVGECSELRVINAGVGGTTIDGQREMIRRGLVLEPDVVVLMFYDNDVAEMAAPTFWDIMAENRRRKSTFPLSIIYSTLNRTATWSVLRQAATRLAARTASDSTGRPPAERTDSFWEESYSVHRELYAEELRQLVAELDSADIPLVLLRYPSHVSILDPDVFFNPSEWLSALTEEIEVPFLDLTSALEESELSLDDLYFTPWDGHARPIGYELSSAKVSEKLLALDQVRGWCSDN